MKTITLTPPRGRDYASTLSLETDLKAGRDFIVDDPRSRWDGKPCNIDDLVRDGITEAHVRYFQQRKLHVVKIERKTH